jgi:hypothetical protein
VLELQHRLTPGLLDFESRNSPLLSSQIPISISERYFIIIIMNESIKREPKIRGIYECRCDERLQTKSERLQAFCFFHVFFKTGSLPFEKNGLDQTHLFANLNQREMTEQV